MSQYEDVNKLFNTSSLNLFESKMVDLVGKTFICGMVAWQTLSEIRSEIEIYRSQSKRRIIDG